MHTTWEMLRDICWIWMRREPHLIFVVASNVHFCTCKCE
jgi:hypothetical protein